MKQFFVPEDFDHGTDPGGMALCDWAAKWANAKLLRESRVMYGGGPNGEGVWSRHKMPVCDHTALLINIQPIAKCEHSAEKVSLTYITQGNNIVGGNEFFMCRCGAKVKPNSFVEIK